MPIDELDRRLASLAEAGEEHAEAPAPAVIRRRARRRRARRASAVTAAVVVVAAAAWLARPTLVRESGVVGPAPVSAPPGAVPWVREPARPRAPTPTTPGVRLADLAVAIDAPGRALTGRPLRYTVTITNASQASLPLRPCPNYDQRLAVEGASPVLQPYRLNCQPIAAIHPGERVTFVMEFAVPATLRPGRAVLIWNLDLGPGAQFKPIQVERP